MKEKWIYYIPFVGLVADIWYWCNHRDGDVWEQIDRNIMVICGQVGAFAILMVVYIVILFMKIEA